MEWGGVEMVSPGRDNPFPQGILRLVGEMEAFTIQGDEYIKVDAKPGRLPGRNVIRAIIKSLVG